jgi:hypothetical protein
MSEGIFRALQEEDEGGEILNSDSKEEVAKEDAWTVSTSTKTRRLAPSFTLSRKDLGIDSPRNALAALEIAAAKKKGIESRSDASIVSFETQNHISFSFSVRHFFDIDFLTFLTINSHSLQSR